MSTAATRGLGLRASVAVGAGAGGGGGVALATAAALLVRGDTAIAGWVALGGGAFTIAIASAARRSPRARERVVASLVDRGFDAAVFGGLAWAARGSDPSLAAAALGCLVCGGLAAYARARAASLGYLAGEVALTSVVKVGSAGLALALGWGTGAFVAIAVWVGLTAASRVLQVYKETLA